MVKEMAGWRRFSLHRKVFIWFLDGNVKQSGRSLPPIQRVVNRRNTKKRLAILPCGENITSLYLNSFMAYNKRF